MKVEVLASPEMSFLYKLGINEFIENVAELLHALSSMERLAIANAD